MWTSSFDLALPFLAAAGFFTAGVVAVARTWMKHDAGDPFGLDE